MSDKPNHKQIQRACDLANVTGDQQGLWCRSDYGTLGAITALADTIAQLDAMQAERDKARADLGEIDRIALDAGWDKACHIAAGKLLAVATIAAPYRVETDPLVEALVAANARLCDSEEGYAPILRAELAKRQEAEAERDKARADLAEIDRIAEEGVWGHPSAARNAQRVAAIAAPYRVETDPLVAAISAAIGEYIMPGAPWDKLRAELAKRGI